METWIQFGRGPLFRMAFCLMALGLLRLIVLTVIGIVEAYRRNSDKIIPWKTVAKLTLKWLLPVGRLGSVRPWYSLTSFLLHVGMLPVPFFLAAHILLVRRATGFGWPALSPMAADALTILTIGAGVGLFLGRVFDSGGRALSRLQDYLWPLLLVLPFVTGYICSHAVLSPKVYLSLMLVHVYSANLIMVMIPFTKIAHCVLMPFSQVVTAVSWKFVPGAGDNVAATLGYSEMPVWMKNSRLPGSSPERKEACAK